MNGSNVEIFLHHIGYLVRDIAEASAYYQDLLLYQVESGIIIDPIQTAKVQFLRQPGGKCWLELVSPTSDTSKLSNALNKGMLLHHLCYEVGDIENACSHFRARGCFPVCAPVVATAFPGRRSAWFMDKRRFLFELLERRQGTLSLQNLF
jgi:methylmalonyl-CoA/ethylmalonyl-CoA epimerase